MKKVEKISKKIEIFSAFLKFFILIFNENFGFSEFLNFENRNHEMFGITFLHDEKIFSFKFSFSDRTELVLLDSPFSSESEATKISYNFPAHRHVGAQNVTKS